MLKLRRQNLYQLCTKKCTRIFNPQTCKRLSAHRYHKIVSAQIIKSLLRDRYFEIGTLQDSPRMISTGKSPDLKPVFFIGDEGNRSPGSSNQFNRRRCLSKWLGCLKDPLVHLLVQNNDKATFLQKWIRLVVILYR